MQTLSGKTGKVAGVAQAHVLLHGDEVAALGATDYSGVEKRDEKSGVERDLARRNEALQTSGAAQQHIRSNDGKAGALESKRLRKS